MHLIMFNVYLCILWNQLIRSWLSNVSYIKFEQINFLILKNNLNSKFTFKNMLYYIIVFNAILMQYKMVFSDTQYI